MSGPQKDVNMALSDIEYVRQILEPSSPRRAFKSEAMMTLLLLGAATTFLTLELVNGGFILTRVFESGK